MKTMLVFILLVSCLAACPAAEQEEDLLATCGAVGDLMAISAYRLCPPQTCAYQGVLFDPSSQACQITLLARQELGGELEQVMLNLWPDDLAECVGMEAMCAGALLVALDRQYPLLVGPQDGRMLLDSVVYSDGSL